MPFICHHCGKHLSRQQRLDSHITRFHGGEDGEKCHDVGVDERASPKERSTSYVDLPECNVENKWTEKEVEDSNTKDIIILNYFLIILLSQFRRAPSLISPLGHNGHIQTERLYNNYYIHAY